MEKNVGFTYLFKYINISIIGYAYVFLLLFITVEYFRADKKLSFVLVYGSWYIIQYFFQLKYIFNKTHRKKTVLKYILYIMFFFTITTVIYSAGINNKVHYLISYGITIFLITPLRYLVIKNFVFN